MLSKLVDQTKITILIIFWKLKKLYRLKKFHFYIITNINQWYNNNVINNIIIIQRTIVLTKSYYSLVISNYKNKYKYKNIIK